MSASRNAACVSQRIAQIPTITKAQRQKRLTCRAVLEFTGPLCLYDLVVTEKIREHRINELKELFSTRLIEKKCFFKNNTLLISTYEFVCKIVEDLFSDVAPHLYAVTSATKRKI